MDGWIKLHRKSYENYLYTENRPHTKREAWEDILVHVNYEDSVCMIGNDLVECKRGQSLMSLESWGNLFHWEKWKVKMFFDTLSKATQITTENLRKTTRLTVLNYDYYQGLTNTEPTENLRKPKRKTTPIKEEKKDIDKSISLWREDFSVYLAECKAAYRAFNEDLDAMKMQQELNPGVNVKLSIKAGFINYWGTEDGWIKKKSSPKNINWKKTIINSIKLNKVYYTKQELLAL